MIIDCHGHYTTEPAQLHAFRDRQLAALADPSRQPAMTDLGISDNEIRQSLEAAQLKLQMERGTDVTIFSPRAAGMAHHVGTEATSREWTRVCNDPWVCALYPRACASCRKVLVCPRPTAWKSSSACHRMV